VSLTPEGASGERGPCQGYKRVGCYPGMGEKGLQLVLFMAFPIAWLVPSQRTPPVGVCRGVSCNQLLRVA